ncbi:hypothetical protein [Streptomyces fagopyri]|uniref:hypothetical protein n=1 Tax=Streptomyces fagopyri TaxID=2662397 RepID=UPI0037163F10
MAAAAGFPVIVLTAGVAVAGCFWMLVALGVTASESFDADVDLEAWGMGGVPVALAVSLLTLLAWILGVGMTVLLVTVVDGGVVTGVLRPVVSAGALFAAWRLTRRFVRPLHRLFPDERGSARSVAGRHGAT